MVAKQSPELYRSLARQALARCGVVTPRSLAVEPAAFRSEPTVVIEPAAPTVPSEPEVVPTSVLVVDPSQKSPPVHVATAPVDAMYLFRVFDEKQNRVLGEFPGRYGILDAQALAKKFARAGNKCRVEKRATDEVTGKLLYEKKKDGNCTAVWTVMSYNALPGQTSAPSSGKPWVDWASKKRGRPKKITVDG